MMRRCGDGCYVVEPFGQPIHYSPCGLFKLQRWANSTDVQLSYRHAGGDFRSERLASWDAAHQRAAALRSEPRRLRLLWPDVITAVCQLTTPDDVHDTMMAMLPDWQGSLHELQEAAEALARG